MKSERTRLEAALLKARAAGIQRERSLYASVPASEVEVMEREINGATIAGLIQFYETVSVDPAAALVVRKLITATLRNKLVEGNETMDLEADPALI